MEDNIFFIVATNIVVIVVLLLLMIANPLCGVLLLLYSLSVPIQMWIIGSSEEEIKEENEGETYV